jgi:hypothetical protein
MGNILPANQDIGHKYRSSSKVVKEMGFDNFIAEVIKEFDGQSAREDAFTHEQTLIREYIDDPLCLNKAYVDMEAGQGAYRRFGPMSDETKAKMRENHIGTLGFKHSEETKLKMSSNHAGRLGTTHSAESKQKISESMRGKKRSEETKQKIRETMKKRKRNE